jgi:uncharacterized membrane protein YkvA (DUF1232 family)
MIQAGQLVRYYSILFGWLDDIIVVAFIIGERQHSALQTFEALGAQKKSNLANDDSKDNAEEEALTMARRQ